FWRNSRDEEARVEPTRIDRRRHPVRERDQRIDRQAEPFAFENLWQRSRAVVQLGAILFELRVLARIGERDELVSTVTREEDACLFEQLTRGRDVKGEVAAGHLRIGFVDAAAWKHVRATHERGALMAADEEDFRTRP